jgi:hypothetical protein
MIVRFCILLSLFTCSIYGFKIKNNSGFKVMISVVDHHTNEPLLANIPICRGAIVGFEPLEKLPQKLYALRAVIDDKKSLPMLANRIDLTKDTLYLIDLTKHERPIIFNCANSRRPVKKCRKIPKHKKTGSMEIIPGAPFKQVSYQEVIFAEA